MVAIIFAASAGFHGPGRIAAITLICSVAARSAWLKATDFVLVVGAVAGGEADLAERVVEAGSFRDPGQLDVVVETPVGALDDLADHQAARDVRHPVGELERLRAARDGLP